MQASAKTDQRSAEHANRHTHRLGALRSDRIAEVAIRRLVERCDGGQCDGAKRNGGVCKICVVRTEINQKVIEFEGGK